MARTRHAGITSLCKTLGLSEGEYRLARSQASHIYIEQTICDRRNGKPRKLCYPPAKSTLRQVQVQIKERILESLELLPEVRGYRKGSHNIVASAVVCKGRFMGKVDITKFHPSTTPRHIAAALSEHGISESWSREIARLVTYKNQIPQGAPTSNHIANIVMDSLLRRFIKPIADRTRISFVNFGDDIAFFGDDAAAVRKCVRLAKGAISKLGFKLNDKCVDCEHRGGKREFIGCSTGRDRPDYGRAKYIAFRKELRGLLQAERMRCAPEPLTSRTQLNSLRQRIVYVKRLNHQKARRLFDLFYRLCAARRRRTTEDQRRIKATVARSA